MKKKKKETGLRTQDSGLTQHSALSTQDSPALAVLVLNWNGRRWLEACFSALAAQEEPHQAWLVDNGSTDGSVELVEARFPAVRVLRLGRNLGFGAAYNRAIAACPAPLVVLLNNDTAVQPGWLTALRQDMDAHPEAAAVGSKLLFAGVRGEGLGVRAAEGPFVVNHAGGKLTVLGAAFDIGIGTPEDPPSLLTVNPPVSHLQSRTTRIGCASGAALMVRKEAFVAVGGFDQAYFAYFEDADLCWRFWLAGWTVRYVPAARVLHAYGGSTGEGRLSPFRIEHCQANRLLNMVKHLEAPRLAAYLPASVAYDGLRLASYVKGGRLGAARALLRGTARFARLLPAALGERRRAQALRMRSDRELARLGVLAGLRESAREWRRIEHLGSPR